MDEGLNEVRTVNTSVYYDQFKKSIINTDKPGYWINDLRGVVRWSPETAVGQTCHPRDTKTLAQMIGYGAFAWKARRLASLINYCTIV